MTSMTSQAIRLLSIFVAILWSGVVSAATLASIEIGGDYTVTNSSTAGTFSVTSGSFTGLLLTTDPSLVLDMNLLVDVDIDGSLASETALITGESVNSVLAALGSQIASDPLLSALSAYIVGNTGAPFAFPGGTLTTTYNLISSSAAGFAGTFGLTFESAGGPLPDIFPSAASGYFNINASLNSIDAPVPLPASLPLFGAGFGLLMVLRQRRKR